MSIKYRLQAYQAHNGQVWRVMKGNIVLYSSYDKGDAEKYVQSCIEDDNWHAANRD